MHNIIQQHDLYHLSRSRKKKEETMAHPEEASQAAAAAILRVSDEGTEHARNGETTKKLCRMVSQQ
jgi:hypothetical protein